MQHQNGITLMKHKAIKILGILFIILSWFLFVLYVIACSMTQAELADISAKGYDTKHIFLAFLASFILGLLLYNMGSIGMQKDITLITELGEYI